LSVRYFSIGSNPITPFGRWRPAFKNCSARTSRSNGIKTAIVSNTPWGSPAHAWRAELTRHGLLDKVDATVYCMDVGWRKPHRAPFDRALSLLEVAPVDALFVGDDHRWDIVGAQNAGLRPVLLESAVPPPSRRDHLTIPNLAGIIALLTEASL
jgi:FMN phosphatase YigB (HAD superfamily)